MERQLGNINKKCCHDSLPPQQRKALRELRRRSDTVIKLVDKGSAVVVLSKDDYIQEAEWQLNNHGHYEKLNEDPTLWYASETKKYVEFMLSTCLCLDSQLSLISKIDFELSTKR